jgi:hypothetical protein
VHKPCITCVALVIELLRDKEHKYNPADMWNMDDLGFGISKEQAIKVLINLNSTQKPKVIRGKQEWVTVVECISAASKALAPLLILKGQDVDTQWIIKLSPLGWHFAASKNGWTSMTLEWPG